MGLRVPFKIKIVISLCFVSLLYVAIQTFLFRSEPQQPKNSSVKHPRTQPPKLILIYTTLWGNRLWTGFETTQRFNNWGGHPCSVQHCRLTYNKKLLNKADVVIFHGFGGERTLRKRGPHRRGQSA